MLGQEELKAIIQAPDMEQFRQRIIASAHLKPLTCEEVKNYILHRLQQANCNNNQLFSEHAFKLIHEKTLGVPRKINIFVDRLLLFAFLEELNQINSEAINTVAEEMEIELTGSLNAQQLTNNEPQAVNSSENVKHIREILREVEEILELNIKEKIKMTRYIDKLLKHKSIELAKQNIANDNTQIHD